MSVGEGGRVIDCQQWDNNNFYPQGYVILLTCF